MPITLAPIGIELKVLKITANEDIKRHLEDLGITVGSVLKKIAQSGSSCICLVKNVRLALDKDVSIKILVA